MDAPVPAGHVHNGPQFSVYRGCGDATWTLDHSLARTRGSAVSKERVILDEFHSKAATYIASSPVDATVDWQLAALAQHHGVPTRLLDWSKNSQAALHFATSNLKHAGLDAAVWVANVNCIHENLPDAIRTKLAPERPEDPGIVLLNRLTSAYPTLPDYDNHFVDGQFMPIIFFEPATMFERILAQASLFSVVANAGKSTQEVLDWLDGRCRKIVVPASMKAEVRLTLDNGGFTEAMYHHDMDGIGAFLARRHKEP